MRNPLALASLAMLLAMAAPEVFSQDRPRNPARGWYMGAEAGISQLDGEVSYEGEAAVPFTEESLALVFHAGYRFNRIVSLGVFAGDYGKFSDTRGGFASEANVEAFGVQFVGRVPLGKRFGLMGIAMLFFHDVDFRARVPDGTVLKDDGGGANTRIGLGLNYQFNPHTDLRLEVQHTGGIGHGFMTFDIGTLDFEANLHSVTLGLRYKF